MVSNSHNIQIVGVEEKRTRKKTLTDTRRNTQGGPSPAAQFRPGPWTFLDIFSLPKIFCLS